MRIIRSHTHPVDLDSIETLVKRFRKISDSLDKLSLRLDKHQKDLQGVSDILDKVQERLNK